MLGQENGVKKGKRENQGEQEELSGMGESSQGKRAKETAAKMMVEGSNPKARP